MSKRNEYSIQLKPLIMKGAFRELEEFLTLNSDLPGPRANLELAYAFAYCLKELQYVDDLLWDTLNKWAKISEEYTAPDSPKEFIPFCAVQALGSIFSCIDSKKKEKVIDLLQATSNDSRWRVREAVAIGLQWIEEEDFSAAKSIFIKWIDVASLLQQRAIIAALAHPPVLNNKDNVLFCLEITEVILVGLTSLDRETRKTEEFRVLKKGLDYAISVFVAKACNEGFDYLKRWTQKNDKDIHKIIKSNLGKSRLTQNYEKQVNEVLGLMDNCS